MFIIQDKHETKKAHNFIVKTFKINDIRYP